MAAGEVANEMPGSVGPVHLGVREMRRKSRELGRYGGEETGAV